MKIYIASSWKNQHAVEMLTKELRNLNVNVEVISWIENNYGENPNTALNDGKFDFEKWVNSEQSDKSFDFDTKGAMECDLFIYVGPAGKDAAAECGMAYAKGIPMIGLTAKGEDFGLMRKMFSAWLTRYTEVLSLVRSHVRHSTTKEKA